MRLKYGYDRASNRLWREDLVAQSYSKDFDEIYAYDGLHRLRDMRRGRLNGTQTALTTQTFGQCWNLDATGNWTGFKETDNGSTWTLEQSRTANTVNEITAITNTTGDPWSQPRYDKAGNMTTLPGPAITGLDWTTLSVDDWSNLTIDEWAGLPTSHTKDATYDAWNRLIKLTDGPTGHTIQENQYDARTFRTIRKDYEAGTPSETRHFYYSPDWRCVEEQVDASPDADRQFVWGLRYIDELICRDRDTDSDGDLDERLYACQDANWNVVAVGDDSGDVVERYDYTSYGATRFLSALWSVIEESSVDNEQTFSCRPLDKITGLVYLRFRFFDPLIGAFLSHDPTGYLAGANLFAYISSRPTVATDPYGLQPSLPSHPYPVLPPTFGGWTMLPPDGWGGLPPTNQHYWHPFMNTWAPELGSYAGMSTAQQNLHDRFQFLRCLVKWLVVAIEAGSGMSTPSQSCQVQCDWCDAPPAPGWAPSMLPFLEYFLESYTNATSSSTGGLGIGLPNTVVVGNGLFGGSTQNWPFLPGMWVDYEMFWGDSTGAIGTLIHESLHDFNVNPLNPVGVFGHFPSNHPRSGEMMVDFGAGGPSSIEDAVSQLAIDYLNSIKCGPTGEPLARQIKNLCQRGEDPSCG